MRAGRSLVHNLKSNWHILHRPLKAYVWLIKNVNWATKRLPRSYKGERINVSYPVYIQCCFNEVGYSPWLWKPHPWGWLPPLYIPPPFCIPNCPHGAAVDVCVCPNPPKPWLELDVDVWPNWAKPAEVDCWRLTGWLKGGKLLWAACCPLPAMKGLLTLAATDCWLVPKGFETGSRWKTGKDQQHQEQKNTVGKMARNLKHSTHKR